MMCLLRNPATSFGLFNQFPSVLSKGEFEVVKLNRDRETVDPGSIGRFGGKLLPLELNEMKRMVTARGAPRDEAAD